MQDEEHRGVPLAARLLGPVELHVAAVAHTDRLLVVIYLRRGAHDGEVELQQRALRPEGRLEVEQPAAPREQPPAQCYALEIKTNAVLNTRCSAIWIAPPGAESVHDVLATQCCT